MHDPAFEVIEARCVWHVRSTEMTSSNKYIIKLLYHFSFLIKSLRSHGKFRCRIIIGYQLNTRVGLDPILAIVLFEASKKVFMNWFPRWIRTYRLSKMIHKCVVRELEAFFWSIWEELAVHAVVDRLSMTVNTSSPSVVPKTTWFRLFLITDYFRNLLPCSFGVTKGNHLCCIYIFLIRYFTRPTNHPRHAT
jgi:hypothetical protein